MKLLRLQSLFFIILISFLLQSCAQKSLESEKSSSESLIQIDTIKSEINPKDELENEIRKIITAFEKKDELTLNTYLDKDIGLYLIPGPGTLLHYEKLTSLDFSNAIIAYHQFGKESEKNYEFKYENFPRYDCEYFEWDKYGLFVASEYRSILTGIIKNPQNVIEGKIYTEEEIKIIEAIDKITRSVMLTKKDGDINFGIAKLNGKYIITYLDIHESYCDV